MCVGSRVSSERVCECVLVCRLPSESLCVCVLDCRVSESVLLHGIVGYQKGIRKSVCVCDCV